VSTRRFFVYIPLLVFLTTGAVLAGQYQQTKDGRTLVWNDDHKPGDLVSWSGKRDADGYATGYGTLTWYAPPEDMLETGSTLPRKHYRVSSRVSGTMVRGKFGEAPSSATAQAAIEPEKPKKKEWWSIFKPRPKPTPAQIEATPTLKSRPTQVEATPRKPNPATTNAAATPKPAVTPTPSAISNSLDSLVHAPSSLKLDSPTASPSPATPSPIATPDVSLQLAQPPSQSPTP
jgi:hypothetical protein